MRKTKVRIVGDPELAAKVTNVLVDHFVTANLQTFDRAVGRDYAHSDAQGCTVYLEIKKPKEVSP
jgi:hypothetical protein